MRLSDTCVNWLTIIGSDNGLSPGWCQAIISTNAGILLIASQGKNFNKIYSKFESFRLKKNAYENVTCEMAAILSWPQCVNQWVDEFSPYMCHNINTLPNTLHQFHQRFMAYKISSMKCCPEAISVWQMIRKGTSLVARGNRDGPNWPSGKTMI